jgi:hypothetical protein
MVFVDRIQQVEKHMADHIFVGLPEGKQKL